jgi:hypothetical protein
MTPTKQAAKKADPEKVRRDLWMAVLAAEETPGMDLDRLEGELREQADRLWRKSYYDTVKRLVEELKENAEVDAGGDFRDLLHQVVDGNHYVIYNRQAALVLLNSDNADAWEDDPGIYENMNQRAYAALEADVCEEMREQGFDPSAETLGEAFKAGGDDA